MRLALHFLAWLALAGPGPQIYSLAWQPAGPSSASALKAPLTDVRGSDATRAPFDARSNATSDTPRARSSATSDTLTNALSEPRTSESGASAVIALGGYKEVRLVDAASHKLVATLPGHADAVRAVAFSRDGKLLAAAGGLPARRGEVKIWDVAARALSTTIAGHADCIYAAAFSPDGAMLATASYDKLIKLWDVHTAKEIRTLRDHIDAVYALAFTPDGARLVSGSADRSVKIWNVASGERLYTLSGPTDGINTIALSPDGTRVAAGGFDKTIRVWRLGEKEGTLENSLIAHEDTILKLAWSPDGALLASSAADRTIKVFRAADLTEVRTIANLPDWAFGLEFAPGGQQLAAGFFNGLLETYEVDHGKTVASK
jgi:WD40 repeat protein